MRRPILILSLLLVCLLALTGPVLHEDSLKGRNSVKSALAVLFGDGRRLFANHFLSKADAYFHRGRYPSFFETAERQQNNHLVESADEPPAGEAEADGSADHSLEEDHEHEGDSAHAEAASGPNDWIARLAKRFEPDKHVHLKGKEEKEMLPWLKLSVEMDPHNVEAYTVGGYWLHRMGKTNEAHAFVREGQRNNPDSYQIYFELGRLYEMDVPDPQKVVRLYELALEKWRKANATAKNPDLLSLSEILGRLGHVEEGRGRLQAALYYYTLLRKVSPNPEAIQGLIDSVQERMAQTNGVAQPF